MQFYTLLNLLEDDLFKSASPEESANRTIEYYNKDITERAKKHYIPTEDELNKTPIFKTLYASNAYKDMLALGYVDVTTEKQFRNGTIDFVNTKYLLECIIYQNGYIRHRDITAYSDELHPMKKGEPLLTASDYASAMIYAREYHARAYARNNKQKALKIKYEQSVVDVQAFAKNYVTAEEYENLKKLAQIVVDKMPSVTKNIFPSTYSAFISNLVKLIRDGSDSTLSNAPVNLTDLRDFLRHSRNGVPLIQFKSDTKLYTLGDKGFNIVSAAMIHNNIKFRNIDIDATWASSHIEKYVLDIKCKPNRVKPLIDALTQ